MDDTIIIWIIFAIGVLLFLKGAGVFGSSSGSDNDIRVIDENNQVKFRWRNATGKLDGSILKVMRDGEVVESYTMKPGERVRGPQQK